MNERSEFDELLRSRLEDLTVPAPEGTWEAIERGLARRRRAVVFRRFAGGVTAAAAGLAAAWLVVRGPQADGPLTTPVMTAHHVEEAAPAPGPEDPAIQEIAPIAEQIAAFTRSRAVAQAAPQDVVPAPASGGTKTDETEVSDGKTVETPADTPAGTPGDEPLTPPAQDRQPLLSQDDLPADYWREDEPAPSHAHTSHITILSNLTTVASDNDLIYRASPSHSSSQSGKGQAPSPVEPLSGSPKFYSPVSVGLQVGTSLTGRLSVATGLRYTYLVSQYDILVNKEQFQGAYNQLHYLGIPLEMSCHLVQTSSFGFYAQVGGAAEKCIAQRYVYGSNTLNEKVAGLQWSVAAGLGAEYWFVPRAGIYFDPSLVYYFDNKQPLSIRTQQPLQARFEVGLRFRL